MELKGNEFSKEYDKYVGYHTKKEKTVYDTLNRYYKKYNKGRHLQIFMGNKLGGNIRWSEEDIKLTKEYLKENKTKFYVHGPYTINLSEITEKSKIALRSNLEISSKYNASGVVIHVGKYKKMKKESAIDSMYECIKEYLQYTTQQCPFILETPAGQGTELLTKKEDFMSFCKRFKNDKRFKVCIDTCHVFASGYSPYEYIRDFRKECKDQLRIIHLNNSKAPKNSRKDRHCSFFKGEGYISQQECMRIITENKDISMVRE